MEPVTIALAIAKATGLDNWIAQKLGKKIGIGTADKIVNLAMEATGMATPELALDAVKKDPAAANELKKQIMANEQALSMAAYEDRKDARAAYRVHPEQADKLAERIMRWNLPYIAFLLVMNCIAVYCFKDHGALLATISSVLGMAIKSLFDERKEVSGFYFGGSMHSNQDKD